MCSISLHKLIDYLVQGWSKDIPLFTLYHFDFNKNQQFNGVGLMYADWNLILYISYSCVKTLHETYFFTFNY